MKLNNEGWGLSVLLAFIGVFFVAILLVSYISNKYGLGPTDTTAPVNNSLLETNKGYETEVKSAAIRYQEQHYPNIQNNDSFYVNIKNLDISGKIVDSCTGYAKYGRSNDIYFYEPYLSCGNYKTSGYISGLD